MKKITYAGESILTSDDVASALVELTAALARRGEAEAVTIPICDQDGENSMTAELVIGVGNDVLAVPVEGECGSPSFDTAASELRERLGGLGRSHSTSAVGSNADEVDPVNLDYDLI